jgi:hypothetical protein
MTLERYRLAADHGLAPVWSLDLGHRCVFFSAGWLTIVRELWRYTFYLNYPSLDFLDHNLPISASLVIREIAAA